MSVWGALVLVIGLYLPLGVVQAQPGSFLPIPNPNARMPGLQRDGVTIPAALLLEQLQKKMNSDTVQVQSLTLTPEQGRLLLKAKNAVDVRVEVVFRFVAVNWPERRIDLEFSESLEPDSANAVGRVMANLILSALAVATGKAATQPVQAALLQNPAITLEPQNPKTGKILATVWLERVPELAPMLNWGIGKYKVFDYIGIQSIHTEPDQLRIKLDVVP
jgi:hypothetical protein